MTTPRQFLISPALGRRAQLLAPSLGPYTPTLTEFESGLRRKRSYGGLLRQPRGIQIYPLLELVQAEGAPPWYMGTLADWRADVERIRTRELGEWMRRAVELAQHYGVELKTGLDMHDEWHRLAVALAAAHVPAFECGRLGSWGWDFKRASPSTKPASRAKLVGKRPICLTRECTRVFAMAVSDALENGITTPRQIAKFVLEQVPKGKIRVPAPKRGDAEAMRDFSFETARLLVPQLRSAWRDVFEGCGNTFQYQAVGIAIQPLSFVRRIGIRWKPIFQLDDKSGAKPTRQH